MIVRLLVLGAAATLADPMTFYRQAIDARAQRDTQRFVDATGRLADWAPMSPPLRFLRAEALASSGRSTAALADLSWLATNGYHYAFWERNTFASLPVDATTAALRETTTRNGRPLGSIARAIRIDPATLDPEGIAALGPDWLIGSMANGSLYRIGKTGATTLAWRETEPSRRMLGIRIDASHDTVWACTIGPNELEAHSQLLRIALQPGTVRRYPMPDPHSLCNDVVLLPDGTVAVSDSERGAVWQLTADGTWRALAAPGTLGYPNGLAYLAKARHLVVSDLRGLWSIDLASARVAAIEAPQGTFVGGIDGLYAVDGELFGMQNGLRPHRVLRIGLTDDLRQVARVTVIASNLPELATMTTAAVDREGITVLAGSQLVQLVSSGSADD